MSNVKATVLKGFDFKGKRYEKDDTVSMSPEAFKVWSNIDTVSAEKEDEVKEAKTAPTKAAK